MTRTKSDLTAEKKQDLLRAFNQIRRERELTSIIEGVALAIESPSSRFWVTPEQASREIKRMERGETSQKMSLLRKQMFEELYDRYSAARMQSEFAYKSVTYICSFIVMQPAPRFYIKLSSAIKMIKEQRTIEQCRKISLLVR